MGSIYISKSQRILCILFPRMNSGLCKYHLVVCSNYYLTPCVFFTPALTGGLFLYSSESRFRLGSGLFSVFYPILLMLSYSSFFVSKPLRFVPSTPTKIGNTVSLMLHSFCRSMKVKLFEIFFIFFHFLSVVRQNCKIH